MQQNSEVYVGLDTSKLKISVAMAEAGRDGEVRFFGDIDGTPEAVDALSQSSLSDTPEWSFATKPGQPGMGYTGKSRLSAMNARWLLRR